MVIALLVIFPLSLLSILVLMPRIDSSSSVSVVVVFLVSLLSVLVVIPFLIFYAFRSGVQLTATIAVLGVLAGALGWAFNTMRETLLRRAQVLIIEYLSEGGRGRADIRSRIYADGLLFRLNKSIYIDALMILYGDRVVTFKDGKYSLAEPR